MKFNVNEQVTVVLTAYGEMILKREAPRYYDCNSIYDKITRTLQLELWGIMDIFGKSMWNGNPDIPFANNKLEIRPDQWLHHAWTFAAKIVKDDPSGKYHKGEIFKPLRGFHYKNDNVVLVGDCDMIELPKDIVEIEINREW